MIEDYFDVLEDDLIEEIESVFDDLAKNEDKTLADVQPPSSVIRLAACAAAQVFVAFEHGYQMAVEAREDLDQQLEEHHE